MTWMWNRVALPGLLVLTVAACGTPAPPPPPAPTAAPVPTAAPAPTTAAAAAATVVSGTIDAINGRDLSISTNTGSREVQLAEDARIETEGKGTLADLMPGLSVGVTGKPEGPGLSAVSIRIFPAALGSVRSGQFPMNGANQGNVMTNSVIESFNGATLVLNAAGQRYEIAVPAGTEVLKPVPSSVSALAPGVRVLASGAPAADGKSLRATSLNIVAPPPP